MSRLGVLLLLVLALHGLTGCGGGGGGGHGGSTANQTTITGNLAAATALGEPSGDPAGLRSALAAVARLVAARHAQAADVQVCVEGTSFCTFVDDDGVF